MKEFLALQRILEKKLAPYMKVRQSGAMEKDAQRTVDEYFKALTARNKEVVIPSGGLKIVGCDLAFDIGKIGIRQWRTQYTTDAFGVSMDKHCQALGYVNNHQLYKRGSILGARSSLQSALRWDMSNGVPSADTIFFVAYQRAKMLGLLGA